MLKFETIGIPESVSSPQLNATSFLTPYALTLTPKILSLPFKLRYHA